MFSKAEAFVIISGHYSIPKSFNQHFILLRISNCKNSYTK
jgi:hypothetical protein